MPDGARIAQLAHVADEGAAVHDLPELVHAVHVMDHAEVHVVGMEAREQVLEGGPHVLHLARAHVLAVLPCRAEMPLDHPAVAGTHLREGVAQVRAARGVGHPAVEDVHARRVRPLEHRAGLLDRLVHPLAAEADLAHRDAG